MTFANIYFLFEDDMKFCRTVSSATDCTILPSKIDSIRGWFAANCVKLNTDKTQVVAYTRKTTSINYIYKLCSKCIIRTGYIKDRAAI